MSFSLKWFLYFSALGSLMFSHSMTAFLYYLRALKAVRWGIIYALILERVLRGVFYAYVHHVDSFAGYSQPITNMENLLEIIMDHIWGYVVHFCCNVKILVEWFSLKMQRRLLTEWERRNIRNAMKLFYKLAAVQGKLATDFLVFYIYIGDTITKYKLCTKIRIFLSIFNFRLLEFDPGMFLYRSMCYGYFFYIFSRPAMTRLKFTTRLLYRYFQIPQ